MSQNVELSVQEMINLEEAKTALSTLSLPIKVSFKIHRALKIVESGTQYFYTKRNEIVQKYAERDESGEVVMVNADSVKIKEGLIEECNNELVDLLSVTEIVPPHLLFTIDELGEGDLPYSVMEALSPLIKD